MPLTPAFIQLANHIYLVSVMVNERGVAPALTEFTSSGEDLCEIGFSSVISL